MPTLTSKKRSLSVNEVAFLKTIPEGQKKIQTEQDIPRTECLIDNKGSITPLSNRELEKTIDDKLIAFETAQNYFQQQFKEQGLNDNNAQYFSKLMTHLTCQTFAYGYAGIIHQEASLKNLHPKLSEGRTLSLVVNDNEVYIKHELLLDLIDLDEPENVITDTGKIASKFYPNEKMDISIDIQNSEYADLYKNAFIELLSQDVGHDPYDAMSSNIVTTTITQFLKTNKDVNLDNLNDDQRNELSTGLGLDIEMTTRAISSYNSKLQGLEKFLKNTKKIDSIQNVKQPSGLIHYVSSHMYDGLSADAKEKLNEINSNSQDAFSKVNAYIQQQCNLSVNSEREMVKKIFEGRINVAEVYDFLPQKQKGFIDKIAENIGCKVNDVKSKLDEINDFLENADPYRAARFIEKNIAIFEDVQINNFEQYLTKDSQAKLNVIAEEMNKRLSGKHIIADLVDIVKNVIANLFYGNGLNSEKTQEFISKLKSNSIAQQQELSADENKPQAAIQKPESTTFRNMIEQARNQKSAQGRQP